MYTFTVFTPVHNRRHTIHRVWESLINQTFNDFEWIVIDNESEDNILPLLYEYKEKAKFNVTVISHKNRGLHFSWNKAVRKARGELFVTMDSDDRFVPETLEKFNYWWNYIIERYKISDFSGINVLCMNPEDNKIIGDAYPENPWISNSLEMSYKHKLKGEKWGCVRTELLKQRLFPERKTENVYFPETYIWYYLAKKYKILCVNEALRYYFSDNTNQITKKKTKKDKTFMEGRYPYHLFQLNENLFYVFKYDKIESVKMCFDFWRISLNTNRSIGSIFKDLHSLRVKIISFIFLIPSWIIFKSFKNQFYN